MSVASLNTAVTCENPLRDSERVLSRPGAPASAVSIGKVTCFSISPGDKAGADVLICTCLLVMSGTASIGSLVSAQPPSIMTMAPRATTAQRRRIERSTIPSIMTVLRIGFLELGLQRETVGGSYGLAGREATEDFDVIVVLAPGPDLPRFEACGVAHE